MTHAHDPSNATVRVVRATGSRVGEWLMAVVLPRLDGPARQAEATAGTRPQRYIHHAAVFRRVFNPLAVRLHTDTVLFVRGRNSGKRLAVPMDPPFAWEGTRYLVSPMGNSHWARNLRAAGEGELRFGRDLERVRAVELQGAERDAIVSAYAATITCGCRYYMRRLPDPADHPVFRVEPCPAGDHREGDSGRRPTTAAQRSWTTGIAHTFVAQGVKPSGVLGRLIAWMYPLLFRSLYAKVSRLLDLQPEDDVLDVACGSGVFVRRYGSVARRIAGLDHSDVQVQLARRQNRERITGGTAEVVQGDSAALPWGDATFSAVTCNSLGCFAQPLQSVSEMFRVLRPGGRLVLAIDFHPDAESARRSERRWGLPAWTEAEVRTMLTDAGFSEVSVSRDGNYTFATATKE